MSEAGSAVKVHFSREMNYSRRSKKFGLLMPLPHVRSGKEEERQETSSLKQSKKWGPTGDFHLSASNLPTQNFSLSIGCMWQTWSTRGNDTNKTN